MTSATRSDVRFWYRGQIMTLSGVDPRRTVLRWLREDLGATGTKEGCGEGDCGACTVALGTLDPSAPGGLRIRAVNACLLFLPALDGKALFTVEDVAAGPDLHPVQRALVDLHGSQCGFCTPGFVMSLWADYQNRTAAPDRDSATDTLSGNLCRCTGYRPILEAAQTAWTYPRRLLDTAPVAAALKNLDLPSLVCGPPGRTWTAPVSVDDLAAAVEENPGSRLVAGATDLALQVTKGLRDLGSLISVTRVPELETLRVEDAVVRIGAAVTLTDAFRALAGVIPELGVLGRRFASTPVRNAGTLGGNVMNGSPIGDSMPALLALGARLVLRRGDRVRVLPLDQFYLAYQKTAREPGEFLTEIAVPVPAPGSLFRTWKVSKRQDQDISAVCGAFFLSFEGRTVTEARVALGGVAAVPLRAAGAEVALTGHPFDAEALHQARTALSEELHPLTDGRATAAYRTAVAANLLTRLQAESEGFLR